MDSKRYGIYGGISLALHSLILAASPPQEKLNITLDSNSTSINIQFVSSAATPQKMATEPNAESAIKAIEQTITKQAEPKVEKQPTPIAKPEQTLNSIDKTTPNIEADNSSLKGKAVPQKPLPSIAVPSKAMPSKRSPSEPVPSEQEATKIVEMEPVTKKPKKTDQVDNKAERRELNPYTQTASKELMSEKSTTPKLMEKPTFKAKPTAIKYPRLAKRRGHQGKVLVEVWIDKNGTQTKQLLIDSSGYSTLDEAAMKAISDWKFNASTEQGIAIAHRVQIPVNFKLD